MTRFPRTYKAFQSLPDHGEGALAHLLQLEAGFASVISGRSPIGIAWDGPRKGEAPPTYDVALAGGGLSLIYATYLARAGLSVVVFDRRAIGTGHREWNISRAELEPLVTSGIFTRDEVASLIQMQYRLGTCNFHGGGHYPVSAVLDCVIDAERLHHELAKRARDAGATLLSHHQLVSYRVGQKGVAMTLQEVHPGDERPAGQGKRIEVSSRLLLDGMGAQSPHARFDLCCPTVGGVFCGLACDPTVGEILVTTEGIEEGRQHIWEGFPGPLGKLTVYLFYYAEPKALAEHPLLSLYERFFQRLPHYKEGEATLVRPTYGFIPAYSRLRPIPTAPSSRVLLVGDAASRHSPLSFCGFGSMIRSFLPVSQGIVRCLAEDRLGRGDLQAIWKEPAALSVLGGLTLMMAQRSPPHRSLATLDPRAVNRLLDAAFESLSAEGDAVYAGLLKDQIGGRAFVRFMQGAARRYREVYRMVFGTLTKAEILIWLGRLLRLWFTKAPDLHQK